MHQKKGVNSLERRLRRMVRAALREKPSVNPWEKLKKLRYNKQTLFLQVLSALALATCFTLFSYQTYDRILYYFEDPVTTDVFIFKKIYQTFPEITICYQAVESTLKILEDYSVGENCGTFPIQSAVQVGINYTTAQIWDMTKTSTAIISAKEVGRRISETLTYTAVLMLYGTCATFHSSSRAPPEIDYGKKEILFRYFNTTCAHRTGVTVYIHDYGENPMHRHEHELRVGMKNEISIAIRKFMVVNRTRAPCISSDDYNKCHEDCFVKFSKTTKVQCRFPFHPKAYNATTCIPGYNMWYHWDEVRHYLTAQHYGPACACTRKCTQRTFEEKVNPIESLINKSAYLLKFGDPHETDIQERRIYDIITLLSDIGGSSGLFIGLSVLSIFELLTTFQPKRSVDRLSPADPLYAKVLKTIRKTDKSAESRIKNQRPANLKNLSRIYKNILLTVCFCTFALATIRRTSYFLQHPLRSVVTISFNSTFEFPTITICSSDPTVLELMKEFARINNVSDYCEVKVWELFSLPKVNASIIWNTEVNGSSPYLWRLNRPVTLFDGTCFDVQEKVQVAATFFYWLKSANIPICGTNYQKVYVKPATGYYDFFNYRYILDGNKQQITFTIKEIKINENYESCISEKDHELCKSACRTKKLWKRISCSLPYMPESSLPLCNSSSSAKHSYLSYQELFILPGSADDCYCLPPCLKRIYETSITAAKKDKTTLSFGASHNMVESYSKIPVYTIEALLCDIGSWLGATFGFSLLAVMKKSLAILLKCRKTKHLVKTVQ